MLVSFLRMPNFPVSAVSKLWIGLLVLGSSMGATSVAQNIGISTPFNSGSASYFESTGMNWGFHLPGAGRGGIVGLTPSGQLTPRVGFSWNGGNVIPPFGGYNPNAGAQLNYQGRNFSFGLHMAKGASRSLVSQSPSLVVQNGFGGSLFSGQSRPFVTAMIPIVGQQPIDNAVTRAISSGQLDLTYRPSESTTSTDQPIYQYPKSTATQGAQSVSAIKAERAKQTALRRQQYEERMAEAKRLLDSGRTSLARQNFRRALELTDDPELEKVIRSQIESLRTVESNKNRKTEQ